uniref:Uncharacterized protein n=1 Tax=Candidatus Kentrum sp. TUN TaxID=2126343 RepID=A0A450ZSW8_9GAMM|nr:MAG: hypothetical protein BECKTUN1418F_GA0071002_10978 [Candidatus Kentron sp. TUN]VFK59221.1 MAG: hypothetical protein BECKTUN1418D_GA0071000_10976 [Candidatus Kentron sp. TUN]VFK64059.1 MAG: hypothetical protein BECKTUN1418E_GA0071001_10948 [Candidatus Kentron sp. TUN]
MDSTNKSEQITPLTKEDKDKIWEATVRICQGTGISTIRPYNNFRNLLNTVKDTYQYLYHLRGKETAEEEQAD